MFRAALNHFTPIGAVKARALLERFGSIEAVWRARPEDFAGLPRFSAQLVQQLVAYCRSCEPERLYEQMLASQLGLLFWGEPDYPAALAEIYDPPQVLYWRGQAPMLQRLGHAIAMVGTRQPTAYGLEVARELASQLASVGVAVISGLAIGIDAAAHAGALAAGGLTVAVLGSGLSQPSPPRHRRLFEQICAEGLALSEFPPDFPPQTWTFPMRNRIVSGLSQALIVVEAGPKSGTLITVDCANEQGREVFAVPGPIHSRQSQGTHTLIQQGAHLLTSAEELFSQLGWSVMNSRSDSPSAAAHRIPNGLTKHEEQVYVLLSEQPQHVDRLAESLTKVAISTASDGESLPQLTAVLTLLELKGLAEQLPGKLYKKKFSQIQTED